MNHKTINKFMDLLLDHGWHIENAHSHDIFFIHDFEMVWNLTNDDLYKENILTFFIIGKLGKVSNNIKDILYVCDKNGNKLFFDKDNISEQLSFIRNL